MTQYARKTSVNVNAPTDQAPTEAVEGAQNAEMDQAATLLGAGHEMSDVDFAFGAQAEVVKAES